MAVMDEFKEERAALKNAGFKKKLGYFLDYYKWYVIGTLIVLIGAGSIIYEVATAKDTAFYAVMLNATQLETADGFNQDFCEYANIDTDKYETFFDTSIRLTNDPGMADVNMTSMQKLAVYVAAAEVDIMLGDSETMQKYANSSSFYDLREILSPEKLEQYAPYFYYVDMATVREIEAAQDALDEEYVPVYKNPRKPEEMEEPVPVGLLIESSRLKEAYYFRGEDLVLGVYGNTTHLDAALSYIDYLFSQS